MKAAGEILEVLTIGFPFCAFKLIVGALLWGAVPMVGGVLIGLGLIDAVLNLTNLVSLVALRRRVVSACTFSALSRRSPDLGNAVDVLLSCVLVAGMVALRQIGALPEAQQNVWNAAVVLNVLGAGLSRFGTSVRQAGQKGDPPR